MKTLPTTLKERQELNLRQGIKSSLSNLRPVVGGLYLLYLINDKKAIIEYSEEYNDRGATKIKLKASYESLIERFLSIPSKDILFVINSSPIFTSQLEALQVGIELFFRIAKVDFVNNTRASSAERTGGNRFNKVLKFGTNIKIMDLVLSQYPEPDIKKSLVDWLNNRAAHNSQIEQCLHHLLTIFTEETQFKIRTSTGEISFQQEGVYDKITRGNSVESADIHELVGPFRIFKSYVKEGLHPYLRDDRTNGFGLSTANTNEFKEYAQLVSNNLDLIPKRTTITQIENVCETEPEEPATKMKIDDPDAYNKIFYGAPGTGKSTKVKGLTTGSRNTVVTFHPDTDYSTFVGSYKPKLASDEQSITYGFVPQQFAKAYVEAWKDLSTPYFLIIEEINRGNCAQIFGDIFQLLDRREDGFSDYVIDVDEDFANYLKTELADNAIYENKIKELCPDKTFSFSKIALPSNFYIYATMNTSDQSLFPMDSAFKRRWEWEYLPINIEQARTMTISLGDKKYNWGDFLSVVNPKIKLLTGAEDKQLGTFFVTCHHNSEITFERFRSKVMFYLWFEIFNDEAGTTKTIFRTSAEKEDEFSFGDLFESGAEKTLESFMDYIGVKESTPKLEAAAV